MNLTAVQKNDVLVCSIEGDVDINSAPQMKKAFEAAAKNKQTKIKQTKNTTFCQCRISCFFFLSRQKKLQIK